MEIEYFMPAGARRDRPGHECSGGVTLESLKAAKLISTLGPFESDRNPYLIVSKPPETLRDRREMEVRANDGRAR